MASDLLDQCVAFSPSTRMAFLQNLRDKPNNCRVSPPDKEILVNLLTNLSYRPTSQQEFSRRNYVRKTFKWNDEVQGLFATAKTDKEKDRLVIADDMIADVVESVHDRNSHGGWDATWRDVSALFYGILRSDVIFLLKECRVCASDPSKRPKPKGSSSPTSFNAQPTPYEEHGFVGLDGVPHETTS